MIKHSGSGLFSWLARTNRAKKPSGLRNRRLTIESLELRRLLAAAPTSIVFQPPSGQTATLTSENNSSATAAKELQFLVSGVTAGNNVYVYADGATGNAFIGTATVPTGSTTVTVTTSGTNTLTDGEHTFTAIQVDSSNTASANSAATPQVQVFADLSLTHTTDSATVGTAYSFTAVANAPTGDTATITAGSTLLSGMSFNSSNDTFSGWTPTAAEAGTTQSFTVNLTDTLGNSSTVTVFVAVAATSTTPISIVPPPSDIAVGSPVLVGFNDTSASASTTYQVTTSSTSDPTGAHLTATVLPQTNQVLQIVTNLGTMDFELLNNYTPNTAAHFADLVNAGTYNTNADFYRIIDTFMDQGGVGGSATATTIPVELNPLLRFTSDGLLAMANNGVDGNSSEFFITNPDDMSNGFLDFRYTIFGKLTSGDNVRQALAATQVGENGSNETSAPFEDPKIESMSITTATTGGVVLLTASSAAQGPYTVTVSDGTNSQTFTIQAGTDTTTSTPITNNFDPPNPWVKPINGSDKIFSLYNTSTTFTPTGQSADGSAVQVNVQVLSPLSFNGTAFAGDADSSFSNFPASNGYTVSSPKVTLSHNGSSYTVTPSAGFYGMQVLEVTAQSATPAAWDSGSGINPVYQAFVPVYVAPPTPSITSILAGGQAVTTSTFDNNSSTSSELSFNIGGVVSGATVSVYMDGGATPLVSGTATTGTLTLTTNGSTKIADGAHTFTVVQGVASGAITNYANWSSSGPATQFPISSTTINSATSAGTGLTIGLFILNTPPTVARVGALYTYTVHTNVPAGETVTVTPGTMPPGMTFVAPATFTWTPTNSQLNTSPTFEATVTDAQGQSATIGPVNIAVGLGLVPAQVPVNSTVGGSVTVSFAGGNVQVYDNVGKIMLSSQSFKPTDTMEIDLPADQTNSVVVDLPKGGVAMPREIFVSGASGSTTNQVTVNGAAGANTFTVAGNTTTANGLMVVSSSVQRLALAGGNGNNDYVLTSCAVPLTINNNSSQGTLDFSHDAAGVAVNLGLNKGQAQTMAGWNTTLALSGVLNEIIGTPFADRLVGGSAAMTIIHSGAGNDTIVGGSGSNIIVGGGGHDTITGGSGRNLLIAGAGASTIYAAGTSNMVFGGTTNFDANDQALVSLFSQGPNFMYSYAMRQAQARAAKNPALKSSLITFQDSGVQDTIVGGGGATNFYAMGKYDVRR